MAYVYRHIRLDKNEPFYIGIGSDDEGKYTRANEKNCRRNSHWHRIYKKTEIEVEILLDGLDYEKAKEKEIEFIKLYGRRDLGTGCLINLTDGGDGIKNKVFTEEYKRKLSEAAKKRGRPAHFEKMVAARRAITEVSQETRDKLSKAAKGKKLKPEQIELLKKRTGPNNPMFGRFSNNKGIILAFKDEILIGEYRCFKVAAQALGVTATKICACIKGRRRSTGGYTFKRIDHDRRHT